MLGGDSADLAAGAVAALAAGWASLRLLPPALNGVRLTGLARLALHFLYQSLIAGIDVAQRALDPRLPLRCGFVRYRVGIPNGPGRHAFITEMSLLPGTVPAGVDEKGELLIHCLDVGQPVATQLAAAETLFTRAFGKTQRDG